MRVSIPLGYCAARMIVPVAVDPVPAETDAVSFLPKSQCQIATRPTAWRIDWKNEGSSRMTVVVRVSRVVVAICFAAGFFCVGLVAAGVVFVFGVWTGAAGLVAGDVRAGAL